MFLIVNTSYVKFQLQSHIVSSYFFVIYHEKSFFEITLVHIVFEFKSDSKLKSDRKKNSPIQSELLFLMLGVTTF